MRPPADGWPADRLHYEFFGAAPADTDGDAGFKVQLASSDRVVRVPKDRSVVQALADAGVEIVTSCEQGVCGTCLTCVLEGEPDNKDLYLTPEEQAANDQFLPCCSRARACGWCSTCSDSRRAATGAPWPHRPPRNADHQRAGGPGQQLNQVGRPGSRQRPSRESTAAK